MLSKRLFTGVLLIAGLLALLFADEQLASSWRNSEELKRILGTSDGVLLTAFGLLVLAPLLGGELSAMLRGAGIRAPTFLTALAAMFGLAVIRMAPALQSPSIMSAAFVCAAWFVLVIALITHTHGGRIDGAIAATSGTLFSFVAIGCMLGIWLLIRCDVGPWVLAGAILTVKSGDIGAYFTGMSFGRHKMVPWLSPAKSWEGFVGGIIFASFIGGLLAWWSSSLPDLRDHVPTALGAVTGAVLGVVGTFGDLAESLLKRSARIKDSGSVLPGMGGVFDVLDSPLLAGPVVWLALQCR